VFDMGEWGCRSPPFSSPTDAITALTGALQDADFGPLSDQELLEVTRFPAEERRLVDALSAIAAVRSLLGRLRAAPPHNSAAAG
jgi:hypothetical protein